MIYGIPVPDFYLFLPAMNTKNILPEGFSEAVIPASADGLDIKVVTAVPESGTKGIIQILHGMCEHKERYYDFMEFLRSHGYICVIHDHRGHGETVAGQDDLGYFYEGGWKALVEDAKSVTDYVSGRFPGVPVILFGHSMGSLAARSYAKRYDRNLDALIICGSPSENKAAGIGKLIVRFIKYSKGDRFRPGSVHGLSFGAFNKAFADENSDNAWICSNPDVVNDFDNDPLCNFRFTVNGFYNLFSLMQDAYRISGWKPGKPQLPVLFISGNDDPCLGNIRRFIAAVNKMKKAGYQNVQYRLYDWMRHEILNETEKDLVWNDILEYLAEILPCVWEDLLPDS